MTKEVEALNPLDGNKEEPGCSSVVVTKDVEALYPLDGIVELEIKDSLSGVEATEELYPVDGSTELVELKAVVVTNEVLNSVDDSLVDSVPGIDGVDFIVVDPPLDIITVSVWVIGHHVVYTVSTSLIVMVVT